MAPEAPDADAWPEFTAFLDELIPFRGQFAHRRDAMRVIATLDRSAEAVRAISQTEPAACLHPLLVLETEAEVLAHEIRHRDPPQLSLL